jgi:small subunit ribosomal protein S6
MSKTKKTDTPHYELLYLVSNQYAENEVKPIIEKVDKIIEEKGGKITLKEEWGKKRLAYPVKNFIYGYYILAEFDLMGEKLAEVDRALRMMNEVLRHQIVVKKIKTAKEIETDKRIAEKIAVRAVEEKREAEETEKAKDKKKIDLGDLDEKLDKILETDDLL